MRTGTPPRPRASAGPAPGPQATPGADRRLLRRRRAVRLRWWRRILAALAVVGLVAGAVWLVFFSSWLAVHAVRVSGTEVLTPEEVVAAADAAYDEPLATADLAAIAARVETLAPVAEVSVTRDWPDSVHVSVTERQAVAAVAWEGGWRGLAEDGVLFRDYEVRPAELPLVSMRATTSAGALAEAAAVVTSLPPDVLARVSRVDVGSIDDITLQLTRGAQVRWGSADESERKAEVLAVLLEQGARVYDVTAPGRPTLRR